MPNNGRSTRVMPAALNTEPQTTVARQVGSRQLPSLPACLGIFRLASKPSISVSMPPSKRPPSSIRCGYTKVAESSLSGCRGCARNCRRSVSGLPRAFSIHCLSSLCLSCVRYREHPHYSLRTAAPGAQRWLYARRARYRRNRLAASDSPPGQDLSHDRSNQPSLRSIQTRQLREGPMGGL